MSAHLVVATQQEAGIFKGLPLSISVSGIGKETAYKSAKKAISKGAFLLISSGTATALSPEVKTGDLIIPEMILSSHGEKLRVPYHKEIVEEFKKIKGTHILFGPLLEAEDVIVHPTEKRKWHQETGCIAADMESAALLKAASEAKVPFLCIRSISDSLEMEIPKWLLMCLKEDGNISISLMVKGILLHPFDLYHLIRLARGFHKAKRSLRYIMGRVYSSLPF